MTTNLKQRTLGVDMSEDFWRGFDEGFHAGVISATTIKEVTPKRPAKTVRLLMDIWPGDMEGKTTRDIAGLIGIRIKPGVKSDKNSWAIARAMRILDYRMVQKSRRGRPAWVWTSAPAPKPAAIMLPDDDQKKQ